MTKNQKMLLGIGVLAAAGYMIWKQGQKKTPAASFAGKRNFTNEVMGGMKFIGRPCPKSPASPLESHLTVALGGFGVGTPIYECCGKNLWGTAPGTTGCKNKSLGTISMLEQAKGFTGSVGSMSTPNLGVSF